MLLESRISYVCQRVAQTNLMEIANEFGFELRQDPCDLSLNFIVRCRNTTRNNLFERSMLLLELQHSRRVEVPVYGLPRELTYFLVTSLCLSKTTVIGSGSAFDAKLVAKSVLPAAREGDSSL